jgi:hypothetical protein
MDMKHAWRAILMVKAYVNANLLENRYFVKIIRVITVLDFHRRSNVSHWLLIRLSSKILMSEFTQIPIPPLPFDCVLHFAIQLKSLWRSLGLSFPLRKVSARQKISTELSAICLLTSWTLLHMPLKYWFIVLWTFRKLFRVSIAWIWNMPDGRF